MSKIVEQDRLAKSRRRERIEAELPRIVEGLKGLGVLKVILFGSAARGDIGRASDVDLIVVMETDKRFLDRLEEVYAAIGSRGGVDVLVYTPEEFDRLSKERAFVRRAVDEGRVLYEADPAG